MANEGEGEGEGCKRAEEHEETEAARLDGVGDAAAHDVDELLCERAAVDLDAREQRRVREQARWTRRERERERERGT